MNIYQGPNPKSINSNFPEHNYERVTCLINGEQRAKITRPFLKKLGWTKEEYINSFPGAPFNSHKAINSYKKFAKSKVGRQQRSQNLKRLNADKKFQEKRLEGVNNFLQSEESNDERKRRSIQAQIQHKNGLSQHIRDVYWNTKYPGSFEQERRSNHMKENNPLFRPEVRKIISRKNRERYKNGDVFKQKYYGSTNLRYQSSYERDFLDWCFENGISLKNIDNGPVFEEDKLFYVSDFILYNTYVVEIKSWYVEKMQENNNPGILEAKRKIVEKNGYNFIYIKDKCYTEIEKVLGPKRICSS